MYPVGNVPYNMGEEQLVEVFKSVGQVVGFRSIIFFVLSWKPTKDKDFDRTSCWTGLCLTETPGKQKATGFANLPVQPHFLLHQHPSDFVEDHETALSAVRNLNNQDVGGRPLRIDLADSDPFLEGKSTVRGEIRNSTSSLRGDESLASVSSMSNLPPGKPAPPGMSTLDAISQTLATMPTGQGLEMLAQMKVGLGLSFCEHQSLTLVQAFITSHPEQAKILLQKQPQLSYALFQALVLHEIIPAELIMRMQAGGGVAPPVPPPISQTPPVSRPPPPSHLQQPPFMPPFPPAQAMSPVAGMPPPGMGPPPPNAGYAAMPPPSYYRPPGQQQHVPSPVPGIPPPAAQPVPAPAPAPAIDESQRVSFLIHLVHIKPDRIAGYDYDGLEYEPGHHQLSPRGTATGYYAIGTWFRPVFFPLLTRSAQRQQFMNMAPPS
jgi:cleavage stimulation factor subunit 2